MAHTPESRNGGTTLPIRTADEAAADIGHHFEGIRTLGVAVHKDFLEKCRLIAPVLNSSTRASIYRQIFVRMLHDYCDATAGAQLHRKNQLVLVGLANKYLLRVKKLRQGFSVGVSPTYASEDYDANQLPGYAADLYPEAPEATLLYLGWSVPENAPTEISLYLVCNDVNREVLWVIPITAGDDGRGIQEPLPIVGDDSGVGIRVVAKPGERKENG